MRSFLIFYSVMSLPEFSNFKDDVYFLIPNLDAYNKINVKLMKQLLNEKKFSCIYVTASKPYNWLKEHFQKEKVHLSNVLFIDMISKRAKVETEADDCLFITSPGALTELSIAVSEALENIKTEKKFIYFDNISSMLIYNSPEITARFMHVIIGKVRKYGGKLVMVVLEKDEPSIENVFMAVDKVVRIKK